MNSKPAAMNLRLVISRNRNENFWMLLKFTWYLTLNPSQLWYVAPGKEDWMNVSIAANFSLVNHHSENTGSWIPPNNIDEDDKIL